MPITNRREQEGEELRAALEMVETDRCRAGDETPLSADDILAEGAVTYIRQRWTDAMRRSACALATQSEDTKSDLQRAYTLVWRRFFQADQYLENVDQHIENIQTLGRILLPNTEEYETRLDVHDRSKYSYEEVYGYILRWTHALTDVEEWQIALNHHLENNDHHPEFYHGKPMPEEALNESVVDMLAWRIMKNRSAYPGQNVSEWLFEVEPRYLERYVESDRLKVWEILRQWKVSRPQVDHL